MTAVVHSIPLNSLTALWECARTRVPDKLAELRKDFNLHKGFLIGVETECGCAIDWIRIDLYLVYRIVWLLTGKQFGVNADHNVVGVERSVNEHRLTR